MARRLSYVKVKYEGEAPDRIDYDKKRTGVSGYIHIAMYVWLYTST